MIDQNPDMKDLQKAIECPIAFFDLFNFSLTAREVWQYLPVEKNFSEINNFLIDNYRSYQGFYFLNNYQNNINTRKERYNYTDVKFKKAIRITRVFRFIPWIDGIAIGNIIGAHNLREDGDIDFFIITSRNRIWVTRFLCVMITKFLRLRPKPGKTKDKICLSFFVSEDKLNLQDFMISKDDFYFIYWLAGLTPIYGDDIFWKNFYQANNWIKNYLPNWKPAFLSYRREVKSISFFKLFKRCGGLLNKFFKKIQLKIFSSNLRDLMNKDTCVVINDRVLKMHFHDRRDEYNKKYLKIISYEKWFRIKF